MNYRKYHALGNAYVVLSPVDVRPEALSAQAVRRICHRSYGLGADGVLYGPLESKVCEFSLRIFNPDGSEAEKSGNGLLIFARALFDQQVVSEQPFTVETLGGAISCLVAADGRSVTVEMGQVRFHSSEIPIAGPPREVLNEQLTAGGRTFSFCGATIGNPHCVIQSDHPSPDETQRYGPMIERHPRFTRRTNVQFMRVLDRNSIQIEIWERGAGYTLASGSSSCAAAAVAVKLGLCDPEVAVHMPGGQIEVRLTNDYRATMTGPVTQISSGIISEEMFDRVT